MDNQVITHSIKTTLTGIIEGQNVIVDFENKPGELPTSVNAFCKIVSESICIIVINVGAISIGSNTVTVTGAVTENILPLLAETKSTIENILITG